MIAPPHEWNLSKTASLTQLLPVADIDDPRRRSSKEPTSIRVMKPVPVLSPEFAPKIKRATLEIKIPGAFIDHCHPNLEDQKELEKHARNIDMESMAKIRSPQTVSSRVRLSGVDSENFYAGLDSRTRYRQHNRFQLCDTTASSTNSALPVETVEVGFGKPSRSGKDVEEKKKGKMGHFRRLTFDDISPELGIIWNEGAGSAG